MAALAISWTGVSFRDSFDGLTLLFVSLSTLGLVMFVYGFDVLMDDGTFANSFKSARLRLMFLLALLTLAMAFCCLGLQSFWATLWILVSGFLYTYPFARQNRKFRFKSVLFLKNILIGISWGFLILLGANKISESSLLMAALFVSIQVTIGSIIRDFDDLEEDQKNSVRTIPLELGFPSSIYLMQALNFFSGFVLFFGFCWNPELKVLWLLWSLVIIYRGVLIELIRRKGARSFLLQQVNVAACGFILLLRWVEKWIF